MNVELPKESTFGHNAVIAGSPLNKWLTTSYTNKGKKWPPIIWAVDISRLSESRLNEIFNEIGPDGKFVLVPQTSPHLREYVLNIVMKEYFITLCLGRGKRAAEKALKNNISLVPSF